MRLIQLEDLLAEELDLLADHARQQADALDEHMDGSRWQKRARQFKTLAAQEQHSQDAYERDGTVTLQRPAWLDEVFTILKTYRDSAEEEEPRDGVTVLACEVVLELLEYNFSEDEDEIPG